MKKVSRRLFIQTVLVGTLSFTSISGAGDKPKMIISHLINALRTINKPVCEEAAEALIAWASNAPSLHWLYVEQNSFSNKMRDRFMKLGKERDGLLVVI